MIAWSALISAWLAGVLGGGHCLAMCGGFLAAFARPGAVAPLVPARTLARRQLPHNLGRITTYVLLGAIAGATGDAMLAHAGWLPVQRALYVVANGFLVLLAATLLTRREAFAGLQAAGAALFRRVQPAMGPLMRRQGASAGWALGMLWGLVPCAMTYSVLPVAMFAGGPWQGGAVMLAFGLGTLPNLVAAGWLLGRGRNLLDARAVRVAAALVMIAFAALGTWRAFGDPAGLANGPFCLVH